MSDRDQFRGARWLFLRALAAIHLIALVSLAVQVDGLIGPDGILPLAPFLEFVRSRLGRAAVFEMPTVFWLDASPAAVHAAIGAGILSAVLLFFGVLERVMLLGLWAGYLSLSVAGRTFFSFQWDILLIEATFSAWFLAGPNRVAPWPIARLPAPAPSRASIALLRLLAFKLFFSSGVVKWRSGDPSWHGFTALQYHYETQPLPTWIGWYAHQLPSWVQQASVAFVFAIQLVAPFFLFGPRALRLPAAWCLIGLQLLIVLTGNYGFFNLLAIALCLVAFDDRALGRLFPRALRATGSAPSASKPGWRRARSVAAALALVPLVVLNGLTLARTAFGPDAASETGDAWLQAAAPFRTVNGYGLFAVMTTSRREITVEGSDDGVTWKPYRFAWKPGELDRPPSFVAPHQPRLDWQMWFAALGPANQHPWFRLFVRRLLEGSPAVLGLLADNPFPNGPPRWIRARTSVYHFTDPRERAASGAWWRRSDEAEYLPPDLLSAW